MKAETQPPGAGPGGFIETKCEKFVFAAYFSVDSATKSMPLSPRRILNAAWS